MRTIILAALLALAGNAKADDALTVKGLLWVAAASQYCGIKPSESDLDMIRYMAAKTNVNAHWLANELGLAARAYIRKSTHEHMIRVCAAVHRVHDGR